MLLQRHFVEKPWGRDDIPDVFESPKGQKTGEIWYQPADRSEQQLLVKWLFTSEKLSIQVHPSDADAMARGHLSGKEECWLVVDAEPGAVLGIGTTRELTPEELGAASLSGEIESTIDWKPVAAGDFFYIPAGTVHAIGAGVSLVEVQQPADLTYRLYDYGRPRELHLDDGVAVAIAKPYLDGRSGRVAGNDRLVSGPYFWLNHVVDQNGMSRIEDPGPYWLVPLIGNMIFSEGKASRGACVRVDSLSEVVLEPGAAMLVAGIAAG